MARNLSVIYVNGHSKNLKIKKLDYIVLTYPDAVMKNFEIRNVIIGNGTAEIKIYEDFIQAVINKGLKPSVPLGSKFALGNGTFK